MNTRDTVQSLSVTRGPATSTITVDYGVSPPRVTAELRLVDGNGALRWHRSADILPAHGTEPAKWGECVYHGETIDGIVRERPDYGAAAEVAAFALAKRRWRVFYRRITGIAVSRGGYKTDRNNNRIKTARRS